MFRQSELRRQLEATQRELANQKWVFERFLESPAWRMTYPIRWLARQARKIASPSGRGRRDSQQAGAPGEGVSPVKELLTTAYRASLHNFLSAEIPLRLPRTDNPEVSIVLVLFNRAELTLQCLRSIAEHGFARLEVIIIDNASTDET